MAHRPVSAVLDAEPRVVYALLEDPRSLRHLVAGARRIRWFHPRWPEVGTEFHHTVGVHPFVVRDRTRVLEEDPGRLLVLEASLRPFGVFHVHYELEPLEGGRCRLTVTEETVGGPALHPAARPLTELVVMARNVEMVRRFRRLARRRQEEAQRYA